MERGKKLVSVDDFFTAGTDTDFFEDNKHSGKRAGAKAQPDN